MRYYSTIDNVTARAWGLNINLAYLFEWLYTLPSWASKVDVEGVTYYFASKTKAIEELPLLTEKPDTMYRYYKQLEEFGLIMIKKVDGRDYVALTKKAKEWGRQSDDSDKNPSKSGKLSENRSDRNPTYKNTIPYPNTSDTISDSNESGQLTLTPEETKASKKKPLPYYPEYAKFVDQWVKAYPTVGIQMPRDGAKIKQLIEKTRDQLKIRGMPFTEEAVCAFWGLFLTRLKDTWYNGKDLPIIESKYTAIIFELENGKQGQKFTSKATEAADYIASLRKGAAH